MQAAELLHSLGIQSQIHKQAGRTAFFLVEDGVRKRVYFKDGAFEVDGAAPSVVELRREMERNPGMLSSTAILRPVLEAAVYPSIASILGPNEFAYHLQLGGIYGRHGVPRPALVPRAGVTLIGKREAAMMDELGLTPLDLQEDAKALGKRIAESRQNPALAETQDEALQAIERFYSVLGREAVDVDATLEKPLEKQCGDVRKTIAKSLDLLIRRRSARDEVTIRRIESLKAAVHTRTANSRSAFWDR